MQYNRKVTELKAYDVVVAGGGPAGIGAGLASARCSAKTLLLENSGCLGGTSTSGALPFWLGTITGSIPFPRMVEQGLRYSDLPRPRAAVRGICQELIDRIKAQEGGVGPCKLAQTDEYPGLDRLGCHDEFTFDIEIGKRVFDEAAREAGLDVLYYTTALDVEREGDTIRGGYISNKSGVQYVPCRSLIDCTGDADMVSRAGFDTYKGDRKTGAMTLASLVAHIENIDPAGIERYLNEGNDPWFRPICKQAAEENPGLSVPEMLIIFPMVQKGVFMINGGTSHYGIDGTDGRDLTRLTMIGRERAKVLVEQIFRKHIPGAENCRLRLTALYPGIRETRRIVAEYMLTEEDLLAGARFEDTIALAGRHFDLARKRDGEDGQPFADRHLSVKGGVTPIPYRSLIPKGSRNIIAAGRCIAADGQALGPARIMSTCIAEGEAAGTAAAMRLQKDTSFVGLDVAALRDQLRKAGAEIDA